MKKQLTIIGIIALFVCIGLSGCQQSQQSSGETKITDIREHSNNYINQTVTLIAIYGSDIDTLCYVIEDSTGYIDALDSNNVVKPTPTISGSQYKFTGIVRYGRLPTFYSDTIYLEVTKIETT